MRLPIALPALLLALLGLAPSAHASSILYVKGDDLWLAAPDGSRKVQVTHAGGYAWPSQADDGTIVAMDEATRVARLDRAGHPIGDPFPFSIRPGNPVRADRAVVAVRLPQRPSDRLPTLASALRKGLTVRVGAPGRVTITGKLAAKTAKRLHLQRTVARATGATTVRVRFLAAARTRLKRVRTVELTLSGAGAEQKVRLR
ncbi:hypothetical protein OM076_41360 [Solirubrobacter ginsenosidimutans]|uniref:Uncharacterized protein n=1 Tax=Solirubrobacter ginsenosidimutans TaxID=490573 RepID=A0A9X3N1Z2_9ACTN|nr:hypothetical protein [Solirubrobacter ginsenosidimutans]MDA0166782.1 hypothetical protein [Solirubrobacter ginsenosidimutans]